MTTAHSVKAVIRYAILALAMTVLSVMTQAQIYKYKDSDGNVVFSDTPPAEAEGRVVEEVELKPTNSSPPPAKAPREVTQRADRSEDIDYQTVITRPSDQTTIPMGPGNFAVTASLSPPLSGGARVQLRIDGTPVGEPQGQSSWQLSNVFRGEHQLVVERIARDGSVVDRSAPVTVYVLRPSILR